MLPVGNDDTMGLVADPRLPAISFTGGDVGWAIREAAPRKHVHLELGGVGAVLVAPDADLDEVAEQCVIGGFVRSGQACLSVQRIYAHADVHDDLVERLAVRVAESWPPVTLARRTPRSARWWTTPRPSGSRRWSTRPSATAPAWCAEAIARTRSSSRPCSRTPARRWPSSGVRSSVPCSRSPESRGWPRRVREVNSVGGALNVGVFTRDIDLALSLADEVDAGGVIINGSNAWRIDNMPFGGTGKAGLGREGVRAMVEEITAPKVIVIRRHAGLGAA